MTSLPPSFVSPLNTTWWTGALKRACSRTAHPHFLQRTCDFAPAKSKIKNIFQNEGAHSRKNGCQHAPSSGMHPWSQVGVLRQSAPAPPRSRKLHFSGRQLTSSRPSDYTLLARAIGDFKVWFTGQAHLSQGSACIRRRAIQRMHVHMCTSAGCKQHSSGPKEHFWHTTKCCHFCTVCLTSHCRRASNMTICSRHLM